MGPVLAIVLIALAGFAAAQVLETRRRRRAMEARPRITMAEAEAVEQRLAAAGLPRAAARVLPDPPRGGRGSRIGGRPYGGGLPWPLGPGGRPMLFLGQIDFADLPPLEDFPARGLLQLFAAVDAKGQPRDLETAEHRTLRWFPDPQGGAVLAPPPGLPEARPPLSPRARLHGLALGFTLDVHQPCPGTYPFETVFADLSGRLPEGPETAARLDRLLEQAWQSCNSSPPHWAGGHPCFVQTDPRPGEAPVRLDRVLLHLDCGDDLCLGDSGMLNLMISQADLRDRRFDRAFCTWDCA